MTNKNVFRRCFDDLSEAYRILIQKELDGHYKSDIEIIRGKKAYTNICKHSKAINSRPERQIAPPNVVSGWLCKIITELSNLWESSPKNQYWFKKSYVYAGYPTGMDLNTATCFDRSSNCNTCLRNDYPGPIVVNYSSNCQRSLIKLFKDSAVLSQKKEDPRNSRFLLRGYAGEGKTSWLNNLFSRYQDEFRKEKLINVKISLTRSQALEAFWSAFEKYKNDQDYMHIKNYFDALIGVKLARIIREKYLTLETRIYVEADYREILKENKYARCEEEESRSGEKIFALILIDPSDACTKIAKLKSLAPQDAAWGEDLDTLLEVSKSTITQVQINELNSRIESLVDDGKCSEAELKRDWIDEINKIQTTTINSHIVDTIVKLFRKYGYNIFIVFDGVDAHHNCPDNERYLSAWLKQLLNYIFTNSSNKFGASYLIVSRTETVEKAIIREHFPAARAGGIRIMRLASVDVGEILCNRFTNAGNKLVRSKSDGLPSFYSEFYVYLLNMVCALIHENLYDTDKNDTEIDRIENRVPINALSHVFRDNRRKMLNFIILFVQSIYIYLDITGQLYREITSEKKSPKEVAQDYLELLINKRYLFWDDIILREKTYYYLPYKYRFNQDVDLKDSIGKEPVMSYSTRFYGTIPNLLDFILPSVKNAKGGTEDYNTDSNPLIRMRIMDMLEIRPVRFNELVSNMEAYFRLDYQQIAWEVFELITTGLLGIVSLSKAKHIDDIDGIIDDNALLTPSNFWHSYKKIYFSTYVISGIIPSCKVPDIDLFKMTEFTNFASIPPYFDGTISEQNKLRCDAFIQRFIANAAVLSYFSILEEYEEKHLFNKKNRGYEIWGSFGVKYSDLSRFYIKDKWEELNDKIQSESGIRGFNESNQQFIIDSLQRHLELIKAR